MRINNPKLFNGDLLATKKNIASWLGLTLDAQQANVSGQITASLIPISGVSIEDGQYPIYANKIAMGADNAQTISAAIAALQQNVQNVKVYDVTTATSSAIDVTFADDTTGSAPKRTFTVDLATDGTSITQTSAGIKVTDGYVDGIASGIASGIARELEIVKLGGGDDPTLAARYQLQFNGVVLGDTIDMVKDQFLSGVEFLEGTGSGDDALRFNFITASGTLDPVDVPLSGLFNEYTAGPGIDVKATATGLEISGVIDTAANDNRYFSVGANGFKLAGVADDIDYLSGQVSSVIEQVTSTDKFISATTIDTSVAGANDTLYYTADGQTAIYDNGQWHTISMEALTEITAATANNTTTATSLAIKTYVDNTVSDASGAVLDQVEILTGAIRSELSGVSGTLENEIQIVSGAITGAMADLESVSGTLENEIQYVSGVVSGHTEDIEYISGVVSGINTALPHKVELFETEISATQAGDFQDTITGRVIAVYDASMNQVYPDINYAKSTGVSTITISGLTAAEVFTVIYTTTAAQNPNA